MKHLIFLILLSISITSFAQDRIVKKNAEIINCKITEIAADEVKYYYSENPKLIFGIDKALIDKLEFETGEVIKIEDNTFKNPEYYANQNKHALKINFLSPLSGSTEFIYEQNIKPGKSWEVALGFIGLGLDPQEINPRGVFGKYAYKFMRDPDFYMHRMQYAHILKGAYFAPEIALRYMSYDSWNYNYYNNNYNETTERKSKFGFAFLLKLGKQWVFDNSFLLDIYGGIGYGFGGDNNDALNYGFLAGTSDTPIAGTAGIRIGWTFKK